MIKCGLSTQSYIEGAILPAGHMTSRERLHQSIAHVEPDRIPIDLGATPSSGISAIAYSNLLKHLQLGELKTRVYDVVQELAEPDDYILHKFHVDVVDVGRAFTQTAGYWRSAELPGVNSEAQYPYWFCPTREQGCLKAYHPDGTHIATKPEGATFFDQSFFPFIDGYPSDMRKLPDAMNNVLWSAFVHSPWDRIDEEGFWDNLRAKSIELRKNTDYALMIVVGCNLFEWGTFLRRLDNFLMDLYTDEANVERLLDALMEIHMSTLEKVCAAVGDVVDVIRFGDDLGMDSGEFFHPEIYRRLFKKRHALFCEFVHKNTTMHTFLHSCGSIFNVLPDLIEAGFDIINPVQTNSLNMEPERLKGEFGKDITFWGGGVDTRRILNSGTTNEVKDQITRRLEIFSPNGGFVFNTIHNIMPDVPPQNIVAMFEAIEDFF